MYELRLVLVSSYKTMFVDDAEFTRNVKTNDDCSKLQKSLDRFQERTKK